MTTTVSKRQRDYNTPRYSCPHCDSKAKCRTSRSLSVLTQELYLQCSNVYCGHTWKSMLSVVHTIVPSQMPNPTIFMPNCKARYVEASDTRQLGLAV